MHGSTYRPTGIVWARHGSTDLLHSNTFSESEVGGPSALVDTRMTNAPVPLVVDLDGTLTPTDTLLESVVRAVKAKPLEAIGILLSLFHGRAAFKARVAASAPFGATDLPYCEKLLEYLREERRRGRRIILATAADMRIANSVAEHLGIFDGVLASDGFRNLKGVEKLEAIRSAVGEKFVYAGDSAADRPIWNAAQAAILVGASPAVARDVRYRIPVEQEFDNRVRGVRPWLRAIRMHQWVKNLLVFVPLFTSFAFLEVEKVAVAGLAFLAFCLAASANYLINDIADLDSDRAHPRKRSRPLPLGHISVASALVVALGLFVVAFALASTISVRVVAILACYLLLTFAYTWTLKRYVLIDVLLLAVLYTLRIIAGSLAIDAILSSWLLAFSVFVFLSLALVKRCAELVALREAGQTATRGRDYRVDDLFVLWPLGIGAGLCSVVIFGLFISTVETQARYSSPQLLWLAGIGLIYWLARLWIKTGRGEMHNDPIVFAFRDFGSRVTIFAMVCATLAAHFLRVGLL